MSYARFGEDGSNVYIYSDSENLICCGCELGNGDFHTHSWPAMIAHLQLHIEHGEHVPKHVFDRLNREIKDANGEQPRPRNIRLENAVKKLKDEANGKNKNG